MRTAIWILTIAAATAAPKPSTLRFRNLFKDPVGEVRVRPGPRIIGGQEAQAHSIPYQLFLEMRTNTSGWYCGGSLISENYALTAGHCGVGALEAHVTLGAHSIAEDEDTQVTVISTEVTVHAEYDAESITHDISVIKFPEAVNLTDLIQPSKLPSYADIHETYVGKTARISGWGLTDGFNEHLSSVLKYVNVKVISNEECGRDFGELLDSIICTSGDERTGSCNGDSGGPLVVDGVQVGVVSFGIVHCLPGYPSAFSRITSFLAWLADNTDVKII